MPYDNMPEIKNLYRQIDDLNALVNQCYFVDQNLDQQHRYKIYDVLIEIQKATRTAKSAVLRGHQCTN